MAHPPQIGRYQIETHLGSGAFADVYRAMDTLLDRVVALKVLKPSLLADEQAFGRFLQEAKAAAGLMHPHIAWVWDLGQADGRAFIAMRYVDGPSLDHLIHEHGKLEWETALRIAGQVAEALEFAHCRGLVHRDVKPQNIIVSPTEGAVLTDFGLVKAMQSSWLTTTTGSILGTPQYIPPEVWRGQPAGPAADQYALACVLVEMLTGAPLFDAPTPPAVMMRHFEKLDLLDVWRRAAPEDAAEAVIRALAADPGERFESAAAFSKQVSSLSNRGKAELRAAPPPAGAPTTPARVQILRSTFPITVSGRLDGDPPTSIYAQFPGEVTVPQGFRLDISIRSHSDHEVELIIDDLLSIGVEHFRSIFLGGAFHISKDPCLQDHSLEMIARLTELQELTIIAKKAFSDFGIHYLSGLSCLTKLYLRYCEGLSDTALSYLKSLSHLTQLDIEGWTDITDLGLAHLASLSQLVYLNLSGNKNITDLGLARLRSLSNLKELRLNSCSNISDAGLAHLSALPNLTTLHLANCLMITDSGLIHLGKVLNLEELDLSGDRISDRGFEYLAPLQHLKDLKLAHAHFTDSGLATIGLLSSIESLMLYYCTGITDSGLAHLRSLTKLKSLDLSSCSEVKGPGLRYLQQIQSLESLNISYCEQITDADVIYLNNMKNLTSISLHGCPKIKKPENLEREGRTVYR